MMPNDVYERETCMKIIGLTGGIAAGKSTVSAMLRELGAIILDADAIAHKLMAPHQPAWYKVRQHFGEEYILPDGKIDRRKLGRLVFSNPSALKELNAIVHPIIKNYIENEIEGLREKGFDGVVVVDAALIFEAGWTDMVDEIWVVKVDYQTQVQRLMERNNLSRKEAIDRINSQMSQEEKLARADKVIDNSSSIDDTLKQVKALWSELLNDGEKHNG